MIDDPAAARAAIAAALEIVLPGRVYAYPPTTRRYVTPSIFVEQPELGEGLGSVVGRFPVWVVVDGTIDAQVSALDDITWNAWLALAPLCEQLSARAATISGLRACVIEADLSCGVETLCGLGAAQTVPIPPETRREIHQ